MTAKASLLGVEREDISTLVKLPGVGKKTAERLVVEMKDRLKGWGATVTRTPATDAAPGKLYANRSRCWRRSPVSALLALGYKRLKLLRWFSQVAKEGMTSEQLIRDALKSIWFNKNRRWRYKAQFIASCLSLATTISFRIS